MILKYKDCCQHGVPFRYPETCDDCDMEEIPNEKEKPTK